MILPATPIVLCVAPNGARRNKSDHPALPMTADELADTGAACRDAGAHALHLHVRTADGRHTLDVDTYRSAIRAIRAAVRDDLIIQVTTEAVGQYHPQQQMDLVRELRPEAASLAIREVIPDEHAESAAAHFLSWAWSAGIGLQYIVYSADEAQRLVALVQRGVVPGSSAHALFVLGRHSASQSSEPRDLLAFLSVWPPDWTWTVCAFGIHETRCAAAAAALGGHLRVGFENNLFLPDGRPAPDNAALVRQAALLSQQIGRSLANKTLARSMYRIGSG